MVLNLKDKKGTLISHNVYWMAPNNDYKVLNKLPGTNINAQVLNKRSEGKEVKWSILLTNNTNKIAFFVRPQLMSGQEEVAPSYWSANYITLEPNSNAKLTVSAPTDMLKHGEAKVVISGWNVGKKNIGINK